MGNVRATTRGGASARLRRRGFEEDEVARLVALKARHDRGEMRDITPADRMRFARYLVESGWLADGGPTRRRRDEPTLAALLREVEELIARRRAGAAGAGAA
jgi:hypothetical protein